MLYNKRVFGVPDGAKTFLVVLGCGPGAIVLVSRNGNQSPGGFSLLFTRKDFLPVSVFDISSLQAFLRISF